MVCIQFTARLRTPIVSPKFVLMTLDDAIKVSMEQRETSAEQLEGSLVGQQIVTSMEVASEKMLSLIGRVTLVTLATVRLPPTTAACEGWSCSYSDWYQL
jgi:hypothetical protein